MTNSLLQALFEEEERRPWTVSEVNGQVRAALERGFSNVWVEGEIVNFVAANSGHWYFTLHDGFSQIKAACYVRSNVRIRFQPFDGLQVRVRGRLSVYEPKGEYQILVDSLEPHGEGALLVAFEQIKAKLAAEGLFDDELKRDLPFFPRRIGVVTSPNGAAFHDVLNVISRRTRTVHITLIPTRVQGESAGEEIEDAIRLANSFNRGADAGERIDVLIVGRGGGSAEDLWAFNEERVARAIRASDIPVISAVGHEVDHTIADLVADRRAPTPSAAAEMVAESEAAIEQFIFERSEDLRQAINFKLLSARSELGELSSARAFSELPKRVGDLRFELEDLRQRTKEAIGSRLKMSLRTLDAVSQRLSPVRLARRVADNKTRFAILRQKHASAMTGYLDARDERLKVTMASLDALSPLSVLKRGFSLVQDTKGRIVTDARAVNTDETISIRLSEGKLSARVVSSEGSESDQ
jgi:exodeoxyribonuclease VII large subunit